MNDLERQTLNFKIDLFHPPTIDDAVNRLYNDEIDEYNFVSPLVSRATLLLLMNDYARKKYPLIDSSKILSWLRDSGMTQDYIRKFKIRSGNDYF